MFPIDDICNVEAAKGAAQRLFRKYKNLAEKQQPILGKQEVGKLMKDTYQAINMPYNPNEEDVFSFISVFDSNNDGKIELQDIQQMAVKYLCGNQALLGLASSDNKATQEKKRVEEKKQTSNQFEKKSKNVQISNDYDNSKQQYKSLFMEKPIVKLSLTPTASRISQTSQQNNLFASHLTPKSKASQKQSISTNLRTEVEHKSQIDQLIIKGRQLFQKHSTSSKGVTENTASKLISETYGLFNKNNFKPSEEDVKIWMKLCDRNKDGIIEWQDYKFFLNRTSERNQ